jgi:uncharacterized membrane protein
VSLLTVSVLPFPTALLGAHSTSGDHFAIVFYAASMTVASVALTVTWLYALHFGGLLDETLDPHATRQFTVRIMLTSALFLVSVGAAFFGLPAAIVFWLVLLPAARVVLARRYRHRQRLAGAP